MELELSPEQRSYHQTIRKFLDATVPLDHARELKDSHDSVDDTYWTRACELGVTSMLVPEEQGGGSISGVPIADLVVVAEEMGRQLSPSTLLPGNIVASALAGSDNPDHREAPLESVMSGETAAAWVVAGADARWDVDHLAISAQLGADGVVLTGEARLVEAGPGADLFLVAASSTDGPLQVLVPADSPGLSVRRMTSLDFTREIATVVFDGVRLDQHAIVHGVASGRERIERQVDIAILLQGAETMGAVDRVFEMTMEYVRERVAFGRPIGSYQALKHRLADHKLWLEAGHGIVGALTAALADESDDVRALGAAVKAHVSTRATDLVQDAIQMHGGIGVTWEHDLHLFLRRVTLNRNLLGEPSVHLERLSVMAGI